MNDRYLRTGVFLAPFHALGENPTLALDRDMDLLVHLDRLNYHEAWIGEHHSGGFEIIACPEMFIAAAARETRHIRLGTGVVSLPYHHPFTLARRMVQLDHMTRGRAMFGVGPGSLIYDAEKIGLKAADQRRRMDESLDCIMRADARRDGHPQDRLVHLAGREAAAHALLAARTWRWRSPPRARRSAPWRPASTASACCRSAAPRTKRWRRTPATGASTRRPHAKPARRPTARAGASSPSRTSPRRARRRAPTWPTASQTSIATSTRSRPSRSSRRTSRIRSNHLIDTGLACIGTPDDCIRHFERLWKGSNGGFGAVLLLAHNWADWEATKRSYELMARYVHPHFQHNSNSLREWSYDDANTKRATAGMENQAAIQAAIDKYQTGKRG